MNPLMFSETGVADPWTTLGYSEWRRDALEVRRKWMGMMGMLEEEIDQYCAPGTIADLDEELTQYNAMFDIQSMNECAKNNR